MTNSVQPDYTVPAEYYDAIFNRPKIPTYVEGESYGMQQARRLFTEELSGKEQYEINKNYEKECQAIARMQDSKTKWPLSSYPGEWKITKMFFKYIAENPPEYDLNGDVVYPWYWKPYKEVNDLLLPYVSKVTDPINKVIVTSIFYHPKESMLVCAAGVSTVALFFFVSTHSLSPPLS